MHVYEKILMYITKHEINQTALAAKCGIAPEEFQAMLTGKQKMYAEDLRMICFALNVSPEIFIEFSKRSA